MIQLGISIIRFLTITLVILCFCGCATKHDDLDWMTDATDRYIANLEIAKENAAKLAKVSEFKTCFIRACLGSHIDKLPYEMIVTLDSIDFLLVEIGADQENMTDCQKGQMAGLWIRLASLGILEIIAEINPEMIVGLL